MASSQPPKEPQFKTPKTHFIKTSGRTVLKPPIGTDKIDNIYWHTSQKSPQLKLDESGDSLNNTSSSENTLKTVVSISTGSSSVHEMETQVPTGNDSTDSIYTASTQLPTQNNSPSIHSLNTQIPIENLPSVRKIDTNEMKFELSMTRRDHSIHDAPTQAFVSDDINEAETQPFGCKSGKSIHEMNTQFVSKSDIHHENTQVNRSSIYNAQTQMVTDPIEDEDDDIPLTGDTIKTKGQVAPDEKTSESDEEILEVFDDIDKEYSSPKKSSKTEDERRNENKASTVRTVESSPTTNKLIASPSNNKLQRSKRNESDEEICFEDIDAQGYETFESQPILLPEVSPGKSSDKENHEPVLREENSQSPIIGVKRSKMRLDSDSSTDCEDIAMLPTQNIIDKKTNDDDDDTDFEESTVATKEDENIKTSYDRIHKEVLEMDSAKSSPILQKVILKKKDKQTSELNFDQMATQILEEELPKRSPSTMKVNTEKDTKKVEESFDEMSTQIIEEEDLPKENDAVDFEDMPTQIIEDDDNMNDSTKTRNSEANKSNEVDFEEQATQIIEEDVGKSGAVFSEEIVSPFKIPFISPIKIKRKDMTKLATPKNIPKPPIFEETSDKYYADTQEIVDDLCSQQEPKTDKLQAPLKPDDEIVPCSDEEFEMPDRFRHIEHVSPRKGLVVADVSSCEDDAEEKVNKYVSNLSAQQIKDVLGLNESVSKLSKKSSSDLSDVELTPQKVHPFKFMNVLLPDSQEIKVSVTTGSRLDKTESSSESETDPNSQENTPILFKKKVRTKKEAKVNLTKKFDDALPTRVLGRVRKPPAKFQQDVEIVPLQSKVLKPKFLTEQEDNIDTEILTENITRLKNQTNNKKKDDIDDAEQKVSKKLDSTVDKKIDKDKTKSEKSTGRKKADTSKEDSVIKNESTNKANDVNKSGADKSEKNAEQVKEEPKKRPNRRGEKNSPKSTEKPKDLEKSEEPSPDGRQTRRTSEKTKTKERKSNEKTTDKSTNTQPPAVTKGILKNNTIEEIINLESDQEDLKLTTQRPVRSTRGRNKGEKKSATPEPLALEPEDSRRRPPSRRGKKSHSPPPETDKVRRSKRQRNADSQNSQTNTTTTKASRKRTDSQNDSQSKITSFMKKAESQSDTQTKTTSKTSTSPRKQKNIETAQDQSTVYNISAESGTDSPVRVKRPASETRGPSPKRTRSANANASRNMSLRSVTPALRNKVKHVLFTAFPNEEVKSKLEELGEYNL